MRARLFLNKYYHSFCDPAIFLLTILLQTRESQKYIFSVTRRSRMLMLSVSESLSVSTDLTGVTLVSEDTCGDDEDDESDWS